jgi:pimeloyl-ACP methyl ester carboxylesterase
MPTFDHDGIQFHYLDTGAGLPFFFQHGLGADVSQPFSLCEPPPGIRLIGFDARTHGQTRPVGPPGKVGLATFADDLRALRDHLGIARAVVGGISMGAAITLNFALQHPEQVIGLVQSRPAWLDAPNPWNVRMFSLISRLLRDHGRESARQLFQQTPDYLDTLERWPDVAASLVGQFDQPDVEASAFKFERIITDAPCRDRRVCSAIRVPTLVLANRRDPIHPYEYGEILAALIPGAELRELTPKSVGLEQHNADVRRALDEFLTRFVGGNC